MRISPRGAPRSKTCGICLTLAPGQRVKIEVFIPSNSRIAAAAAIRELELMKITYFDMVLHNKLKFIRTLK